MNKIYITTPIFYVNDLPHIGHAYTTIICDTLAKYFKNKKFNVRFTTGTDEHGLKVEKAANLKNKDPKSFVDDVSKNFRELGIKLEISNSDFIRTTEERHKNSAISFWNKLQENDQIYLSDYKGWYSIKDESFYQEKELSKVNNNFFTVDGEKVEWIQEESYFFKLSNYQQKLLDYYDDNPNFIKPKSRMNEVKSFVKSGLKDLSISRTSFNWGIKIPKKSNHIMYVWIDALTNYLTSLGYPNFNKEQLEYWQECIHIIGKDILKFHGIYWPAMLMAADLPLPKTIFAHGWWTNEGKKISKSLGNTIDPNEMIEKYGLDQFRYFLLREVPLGNDGDFSERAFISRINSDLSNNLGNLIQRVTKFLQKNYDNRIPVSVSSDLNKYSLVEEGYGLVTKVDVLMKNLEISKSLEEIFLYINNLNKFMDTSEPWKTFKVNSEKAGESLSILIESFRIIGIILQPFIPIASSKILDILNIDKLHRNFDCINADNSIKKNHKLKEPLAIFPRYES